jgi:hypothetical protein
MPKVFIVNKSSHNFSAAQEFGELIFLSEGPMHRYAANHMHRKFSDIMKDSEEGDYIVPCSLNVMNIIAGSIFAKKHKRLNLLLFKEGKYIERNLIL